MSCHVPAAVVTKLDGRRLSCHHWIHEQWDPVAGACSSDVRCPGTLRAPSRHAAAFSRTGCAVHSTQMLLTWVTIHMGSQSCPKWCPCFQNLLSQVFSKPNYYLASCWPGLLMPQTGALTTTSFFTSKLLRSPAFFHFHFLNAETPRNEIKTSSCLVSFTI